MEMENRKIQGSIPLQAGAEPEQVPLKKAGKLNIFLYHMLKYRGNLKVKCKNFKPGYEEFSLSLL